MERRDVAAIRFQLEALTSEGIRQALVSLERDGVLPPRFSKAVVNLELVRMEEYAERLEQSSVTWDLAIFDEAHHLKNTDNLFQCSGGAHLLTVKGSGLPDRHPAANRTGGYRPPDGNLGCGRRSGYGIARRPDALGHEHERLDPSAPA